MAEDEQSERYLTAQLAPSRGETWNVVDFAVFLPMTRYSASSVSRRPNSRLNAPRPPMRVGSTSQTPTWSNKYRDKIVEGGAAGATAAIAASDAASGGCCCCRAACRSDEACITALAAAGDALARREERNLSGTDPTIRCLSGRRLCRKEARESNSCWKCFSRTGASNLTRTTQEGANLPCSPPWRRTWRRSMSNALSTTCHSVSRSERPTRRRPTHAPGRAQQTSCIVQEETTV